MLRHHVCTVVSRDKTQCMTTSQEQAQEAAAQAKDKAAEAAGQAKDKARDQVRTQVDDRSTQAGEQVSTQASDVRAVADSLREQGKDGPAKLAEQAADRAEKLGDWLTHSDADKILSDVEDFARKQPMAVVFGGIAVGFAASRFLKASSEQRQSVARSGGTRSNTPQLPRATSGTTPAPAGGAGAAWEEPVIAADPTTRPATPRSTGGL